MSSNEKRGVPEGLWIKCPSCKATLFKKDVARNLNVCDQCQHHFYSSASDRIAQLLDENTFEEWDADLRPTDPLNFKDRKNPGLTLLYSFDFSNAFNTHFQFSACMAS